MMRAGQCPVTRDRSNHEDRASRRHAVEWLDPTGDTAVHNVDPRPAAGVSAHAAIG